ncbi:hypothetical protein P879_03042 [Paragonimus westermani]|uniref:Uncharacterized protein n=1 Tax=Paragonimus westermani TaxID=34504 RepID=A0A8T0DXA3_9TREM|nr:hypothetical protein P879_03042 [Paragonimus westermani]
MLLVYECALACSTIVLSSQRKEHLNSSLDFILTEGQNNSEYQKTFRRLQWDLKCCGAFTLSDYSADMPGFCTDVQLTESYLVSKLDVSNNDCVLISCSVITQNHIYLPTEMLKQIETDFS